MSFLRSRLKSFGHAFEGLAMLIRSEKNMWVHLAATVFVIIAGMVTDISRRQWALIAFATGLVWITEALNTAIEKLCNIVSKEYHPVIKQVKDISAAAVLIAAVVAVAIAYIVFIA